MNTLLWFAATVLASPVLLVRCATRPRPRSRKVLVVALGKLGDTVCTTPVYRAIRQSDPGATVHVLCMPSSLPALRGNPHVARIHESGGNADRGKLLALLRRERFDTVIGVMPNAFGSMIGLWVGARNRINSTSSVHGVLVRILSAFQSRNVRFGLRMNTFRHYMRLVEAAGFRPVPYGLDFAVSEEAKARVRGLLERSGLREKRYVVLNVTAGNAVKEWPEEKFAALARHCIDVLGLPAVLSTADAAIAGRIAAAIGREGKTVDASGLSLEECGALSAMAAAFVSVDTGPLYVAYACGAPVVVIVGPVDPVEQIPPAGDRVAHVPPPPGCEPWVFIASTPRAGTPEQLRAARDTPVEEVVGALERVLAHNSPESR